MARRGIYVETVVRADLDRVWEATQDPVQHVRWDVRFSRISPTGVTDAGATTFGYERRVPLHTVRGTGVSIGERHSTGGVRTSALRFHTADRLSPIAAGRGYWRYVPTADGVTFITGYDYTPGWGPLDVVVRPALGWATAWSFDRLRLWLETGVPPERWPLWSVLWWWRRDRPRAARCRRMPVGGSRRGDQLAAAPASLAALPDPKGTR
ncbi:SRPBCC family protein [Microbacterium sp. W1N]|uniref:SRPBCC family protein n=1 Tax=Microbacterium festucae TaxID=2977531 RepID=UPI0021BEFF6F|nr:SRPBCC family protein [Microbacterium festucae]MCT9821019.1 SRPBCC family protein [Microbacterium festucae]